MVGPLHIPPLHAYWDRPATEEFGDKDPNEILLAVGEATHSWEMVESQFATLFNLLVESRTHAGSRVYGTLTSVPAKVDALNAASEVFFLERKVEGSFKVDFELLLKHYRNAVSRRNDIAHAVVLHFFANSKERGHYLAPPSYSTNKTAIPGSPEFWSGKDMRHRYLYTAANIKVITNKFVNLYQWMNHFSFHFWLKYPRATS